MQPDEQSVPEALSTSSSTSSTTWRPVTSSSRSITRSKHRTSTATGIPESTSASAIVPATKTTYDGSSSTSSSGSTETQKPSTLSTSSASPGDAVTQTSSPSVSNLQLSSHHSGLSAGELAAAIVLPVLAVLALLALAFLFLRRRSRNGRQRTGSGGSSSFLPVLKEKWGSMRSSDSSTRGMPHMNENASGPVVTATQNNSYYTGLDTSSNGDGSDRDGASWHLAPGRRSDGDTTFVVPPPPYRLSSVPALPQLVPPSGMGFDANQFSGSSLTLPRPTLSREPSGLASPLQRTVSPVTHGIDAAHLLAMPLDPPQPSSRSVRSFTSTLYSDTASVHSARAARRSIGPAVIAPFLASGT